MHISSTFLVLIAALLMPTNAAPASAVRGKLTVRHRRTDGQNNYNNLHGMSGHIKIRRNNSRLQARSKFSNYGLPPLPMIDAETPLSDLLPEPPQANHYRYEPEVPKKKKKKNWLVFQKKKHASSEYE
ncbi:hypothetical protein AMATHDRAFT_10098 [Amanita thiersii Skay4041]|uniref:Uncharacterized protein n=1 Tax=Amanita thiersii Skay4041 TaxID=703135 RepID=A0A2A9N9Z7_9AGAR|nr:hypothetical protein AMATHDRAFT_10098 [Amanita thiersii Skay4041]